MEFWSGVLIGFGTGSVVLSILMIYTIGKVVHAKNDMNEKLFEYWDTSTKQQAEQVHMLDVIASVIETKT